MDLGHLNPHQGSYIKESSDSSSHAVWSNFFLSAGIPSAVANEYAITFSQHRIRIDMLREITKEILLDTGIKAMGDIIAILRHAKNLCTQDELKGGAKTISSNQPNNVTPRQTVVNNNLAHRTPITTSRSGQTISSFVGNKVQSRVNLASGALIASNNLATQSSSGKIKRPNSTISESLAKRLRPAVDSDREVRRLPEKTLTVHYPSGSAIARAQQRVFGNSSLSTHRESGSTSIRSRLGSSTDDSVHYSSNSTTNNPRKKWTQNGGSAQRPQSARFIRDRAWKGSKK